MPLRSAGGFVVDGERFSPVAAVWQEQRVDGWWEIDMDDSGRVEAHLPPGDPAEWHPRVLRRLAEILLARDEDDDGPGG